MSNKRVTALIDIENLYESIDKQAKIKQDTYPLTQAGLFVKRTENEEGRLWFDILLDGRLALCDGETVEFIYDSDSGLFLWLGNNMEVKLTEEEVELLDSEVLNQIHSLESLNNGKRPLFADEIADEKLTSTQRANKKYTASGMRKEWLETEKGQEYLERENSVENRERKRTANKEVAVFLVNKRLEKGKSREEVASRLGVSPSSISSWENGYSRPHMLQAMALADFLQFPYKPFKKLLAEAEKEANRLLLAEGRGEKLKGKVR